MKKPETLISLFALCLLAIGGYMGYQWYQEQQTAALEEKYGQYAVYSGTYTISDYAFIKSGKGVALQWVSENPEEDALIEQYRDQNNSVAYTAEVKNSLSEVVTSGERYIVRQNMKLLNSDLKQEKDEYWTLSVYDTSDGTLHKKTYDLYELLSEYKDDYTLSDNMEVEIIEGEEVLTISLYHLSSGNQPIQKYIDLSTGDIHDFVPGTPFRQLNVWIYDYISITSLRSSLNNQHLEFYPPFMMFSDDGAPKASVTKTWLVAGESPDVLKIMKKQDSYFYLLFDDEEVKVGTDVLKQFYPEGANLFERVTIPSNYSKDGQEHTVNSYEEFMRYYKTRNERLEERYGTKDD
ncbi:hypothetical protein DDV21_010885 [Streptococcus chenjunshii]|uniref:Uncharacterized protein n=1 Tax=Streptococcus chenjunshii TaxID=2173853 RepID=A0A372KJ09_9STRE|nr:hypothetical protein [Streptococcus chenjunshii]AXQ79529.1 hypothetical protein DDV21_010885 [Streptococcus chenjunshii]RFU50105.1 hypothetical protein DDV22_10390 [Streptococcus chenjunshii]RFU52257.1 hypothetical protein DDV23_10615 [Streptococcus chenjunshii]